MAVDVIPELADFHLLPLDFSVDDIASLPTWQLALVCIAHPLATTEMREQAELMFLRHRERDLNRGRSISVPSKPQEKAPRTRVKLIEDADGRSSSWSTRMPAPARILTPTSNLVPAPTLPPPPPVMISVAVQTDQPPAVSRGVSPVATNSERPATASTLVSDSTPTPQLVSATPPAPSVSTEAHKPSSRAPTAVKRLRDTDPAPSALLKQLTVVRYQFVSHLLTSTLLSQWVRRWSGAADAPSPVSVTKTKNSKLGSFFVTFASKQIAERAINRDQGKELPGLGKLGHVQVTAAVTLQEELPTTFKIPWGDIRPPVRDRWEQRKELLPAEELPPTPKPLPGVVVSKEYEKEMDVVLAKLPSAKPPSKASTSKSSSNSGAATTRSATKANASSSVAKSHPQSVSSGSAPARLPRPYPSSLYPTSSAPLPFPAMSATSPYAHPSSLATDYVSMYTSTYGMGNGSAMARPQWDSSGVRSDPRLDYSYGSAALPQTRTRQSSGPVLAVPALSPYHPPFPPAPPPPPPAPPPARPADSQSSSARQRDVSGGSAGSGGLASFPFAFPPPSAAKRPSAAELSFEAGAGEKRQRTT